MTAAQFSALLGCLATACGSGSPGAPSAATHSTVPPVVSVTPVSRPLVLSPGAYWMQIYGFALSDNPLEPVCTPPGVPSAGTSVIVGVNLEPSDHGWLATAAVDAGTPGTSGTPGMIDLRFAQAGTATGQGEVIAGSVRGLGYDTTVGSYRPATNVSVTIRGFPEEAATLRGVAAPGAPFLYGDISGRIAFSDPSGATGSCRVVHWTLQPASVALRDWSRLVDRAENASGALLADILVFHPFRRLGLATQLARDVVGETGIPRAADQLVHDVHHR